MKDTKSYYKKCFFIIALLFLGGCSKPDSEEYISAIQKGLDTLSIGNYEKSEAYFEIALEEKPEDEKATAYLQQTQLYNQAAKAFDTNDFETAKLKAKSLSNISEGSEGLVTKSTELLDEIRIRETYEVNLQKRYDEIVRLIDTRKFDEAQEKTIVILNEDEINNDYISDVKVDFENLQDVIEGKMYETQNKKESEELKEVVTSPEDLIELYNKLALPLKVLLATTTVDERAMTPELSGFTLYFNFNEDALFVNIHSGAGIGHPWFIIQYDTETITPVQGLVNTGASGYEEIEVDPISFSKVDLYNRYIESKDSYDLALKNVVEYPEMTMAGYEELRSYTNQ